MPKDGGRLKFFELEDDLNAALQRVGVEDQLKEPEKSQEDPEAVITIQDLLKELEIDRFERIYIATATTQNAKTQEDLTSDETLDKISTLAEYKLKRMQEKQSPAQPIDEQDQEAMKKAANYYIIPHHVKHNYMVGNEQTNKEMEIYTIHDVEGNSLYTMLDENNVSISNSLRERIENYLTQRYQKEVDEERIRVDDVIETFTPENVDQILAMVDSGDMSLRNITDRIDEYAVARGIIPREQKDREIRTNEGKDISTLEQENNLDEYDKPQEEPIQQNDEEELKKEQEALEGKEKKKEKEEKEKEEREEPVEDYVQRIARINHVNPAVVNTRIIDDLDRIKEDSGIVLRGRYQPGEVVAVRIPYKFGYRTFLAEKDTGITIDGKGMLEKKPGRVVDIDEFEDYFRYNLVDGRDGGEDGTPLRKDEGRSYMTNITINNEIREEKFINNGEQADMLREERNRYLYEVRKADEELRQAIKAYEHEGTRDNWLRVKNAMKARVDIDNRYNALSNQRDVTKDTKDSVQRIINSDDKANGRTEEHNLDDDDDWGPWTNSRRR